MDTHGEDLVIQAVNVMDLQTPNSFLREQS